MAMTAFETFMDGVETGIITEVKVNLLTDEMFNHIILESTTPGPIMITEVGPDEAVSLDSIE